MEPRVHWLEEKNRHRAAAGAPGSFSGRCHQCSHPALPSERAWPVDPWDTKPLVDCGLDDISIVYNAYQRQCWHHGFYAIWHMVSQDVDIYGDASTLDLEDEILP